MPTVCFFQDDDGSLPVEEYIASLDRNGRGKDAARMLDAIELLADIGMAGAQELGIRFSRIIDRELRIWELRIGGQRIAYIPIDGELILLHAWRKSGQRLDPAALNRARRNCRRARGAE